MAYKWVRFKEGWTNKYCWWCTFGWSSVTFDKVKK